MNKDMTQEEADEFVKKCFDEFEFEDKIKENLLKNKSIRPNLNHIENKYVLNYYQNCPIFRELMHREDDEALKVLWRIKDFKAKLNKETMSKATAFNTCKNCLLNNKKPACKTRCL